MQEPTWPLRHWYLWDSQRHSTQGCLGCWPNKEIQDKPAILSWPHPAGRQKQWQRGTALLCFHGTFREEMKFTPLWGCTPKYRTGALPKAIPWTPCNFSKNEKQQCFSSNSSRQLTGVLTWLCSSAVLLELGIQTSDNDSHNSHTLHSTQRYFFVQAWTDYQREGHTLPLLPEDKLTQGWLWLLVNPQNRRNLLFISHQWWDSLKISGIWFLNFVFQNGGPLEASQDSILYPHEGPGST